MNNIIQKNDFIEMHFTGRVKNGEIFDTNIPENARKIGIELDKSNKPYIICLGHGMILPKIDDFLIGKEIGKDYILEVSPDEGFGQRRREFLKVLPMEIFRKQKMAPQVGAVMTFDGMPARISAVSGGRVTVDFNNPLAGKEIVYELKINKKIDDINEKVRSLIIFYLRNDAPFAVNDKEKKIILKIDERFKAFLPAFSPKFKEILGMDVVIEEKEEKLKPEEVRKSAEENKSGEKSKKDNGENTKGRKKKEEKDEEGKSREDSVKKKD